MEEGTYGTIRALLRMFERNRVKVRYAYLGVALSLLRIPYPRQRHHYFCSQFVAEVLQHSRAVRLEKKSTRTFPGDFRYLPGVRLRFQGNMQSMLHYMKQPTPIG